MQSPSAVNIRHTIASLLLLAVSAAHGASCSVTSLPALNFGNYDPYSAVHLDVATSGQVFCTRTSTVETVTVNIFLTTGGSGSYFPRQLRNGPSNTLNYNLYLDAARTTIFGQGAGTGSVGTTTTLRPSRPTLTVTTNIYGRIFAGQDPAVGTYTDTVVYTVNY
jgi:spore coat protein U-like protein